MSIRMASSSWNNKAAQDPATQLTGLIKEALDYQMERFQEVEPGEGGEFFPGDGPEPKETPTDIPLELPICPREVNSLPTDGPFR